MFDSEFLKKLEYLSLVSRRMFRGRMPAHKRTRHFGSGVEFADHRDYAWGDDLRNLDWNVLARLGGRFVKRFEEEEDVHCYFFLDCSRSMEVGRPCKFDYARRITAALSYVALSDLDRVGVVAFDSRIREVFPPARGKHRILSLFRFLESLSGRGETTNLKAVASDFLHRKQRVGPVVLVSDLFDPNGFQDGVDQLRYRGFEPNLVQIHDALEAEPPLRGAMRLVDLEDGQTQDVTINEAVVRRYRAKFTGFLESVKRYALKHGLNCTISRTSVPFDDLILRMMRESGSLG